MKKKPTLILALILAVAAVTAAIFVVTGNRDGAADGPASSQGSSPVDQDGTAGQGIRAGDTVATLATDKPSYAYGDNVKITAVIRNGSDAPKTYTFSSTCTQGELYIDGKPTQHIWNCGQAITNVVLEPGADKTYDYGFQLVKAFSGAPSSGGDIVYERELLLQPGKHQAYLDWQGIKSADVSFEVLR